MKTATILEELEQAARQLDYEVRYEKGNFRGGPCAIDGESIIMLNKRHLPETQLVVLANALRDAPIDTIYLKPAVREAVEEVWADSTGVDDPADPAPRDNGPRDNSTSPSPDDSSEPEVLHADG